MENKRKEKPIPSPLHSDVGSVSAMIRDGVSSADLAEQKKHRSMTHQSYKEEADINFIVKRYPASTGFVDPLVPRVAKPQYGDFYSAPEFYESQDAIAKATSYFSTLSAETRLRFGNDVGLFLAYVDDVSTRAQAVKEGLIAPSEPENNSGVFTPVDDISIVK